MMTCPFYHLIAIFIIIIIVIVIVIIIVTVTVIVIIIVLLLALELLSRFNKVCNVIILRRSTSHTSVLLPPLHPTHGTLQVITAQRDLLTDQKRQNQQNLPSRNPAGTQRRNGTRGTLQSGHALKIHWFSFDTDRHTGLVVPRKKRL